MPKVIAWWKSRNAKEQSYRDNYKIILKKMYSDAERERKGKANKKFLEEE